MSDGTPSRYNFSGYFFGNKGDFNLFIETRTSDFGYLTQYSMELTPSERQDLITILINAQGKKAE